MSKPGEIAVDDESQVDRSLAQGVLTTERIRSFMVDYYEDFDSIFKTSPGSAIKRRKECLQAFVEQYYTPDFIFIRPSGNPVDTKGFVSLMAEHIVAIRVELVSIDSIQLLAGGMAAVVVFTADQEFLYKGKPESDRAKITAVLHTVNNGREGLIQVGHEHRTQGKPIPKKTQSSRWEAS